ncbi:MAG: hypothetical protein IJ849_11945 [Selenomonadaceae bacterium]|nr:hypothetical protein [Selenomonadaceae bacterium]
MEWLVMAAFLWMIVNFFLSFVLRDQVGQLRNVKEIGKELAIYEQMMAGMAAGSVSNFYGAMQLAGAICDSFGFALAYAYVPLTEVTRWIFFFIVLCYGLDMLLTVGHVRKLQRLFRESPRPLPVFLRYIRYCTVKASPVVYVATYGKTLVAVNLFLQVI